MSGVQAGGVPRVRQGAEPSAVPGQHAGRVAIVTGGAHGIGRAIVRRLAAEGARVAIADIADAEATLRLVREGGGEAFAARCDLADPSAIGHFVDEVRSCWDTPAVLVHNAVRQFVCPIEQLSPRDLRQVFTVNVEAAFHLIQAVLPGMKANSWGRIVLMSSSTFFVGAKGMAHYVASKGALIGLVHGLSHEIGELGITINALAPGLTRTEAAVKELPAAFFDHIATLQAIPRNGTPEDQAGVVSFLVSDDAAFITGQTLLADGGQGHT